MSSYYEKLLATGKVKCIDEEIPFEIPQGWEWCRLVEVGKTETGTTPSKSHPEFFGDYIPFLGPANILNSKIVSVTQGLSDIGVDYGRIVPKNTILQVCIGGSIGKCAITDKPVTFNQQINSITPYLCNVEFVHIVLQSEYFRLAIMDKATGTATPIINRGNWETLLFPLPPINEQERIVANITELTHFLGIYSNKQEELNKLNSNMYQRLKKAILQEAIQGKLVPRIAEEGTAQDLLKQIKEEKLKLVKEGKLKKSALKDSVIFKGDDNKYWEKNGKNVVCIDKEIPFEIPNNWNWCRLKDIGKTETGTTPSKLHPEYFGNYIPFLSPANIFGSKIISETQGLSNIGVQFGRVVPKNSILQVCIGGSIGKCAIVNKPTTFNQQINSITPYFCNVEFVHIVLQSEYFRLAIIDKATGTATPIINRGNWETLLFPLPPLKEQQRIIEKYKSVTSIMSR